MIANDDTAWLEALAGRAEEAEPAAGAHEAGVLRALIHARVLEDSPAVAPVDPAREAELIERARAEGLLPAPTTPPAARRGWRWLIESRGVLALAAVATVAVAVALFRPVSPPAETVRGSENGVVRIEARDPQRLRQQLTEELRAVGVRVSGYERLGRLGLDAELPEPVSPEVRRVLERHHIPLPTDGALVVEIGVPSDR
jgi:chorismate mutase